MKKACKQEKKDQKEQKKEVKKRLQMGEWTQPDKPEVIPKIARFNWADEA
jgi:hypothetical protein